MCLFAVEGKIIRRFSAFFYCVLCLFAVEGPIIRRFSVFFYCVLCVYLLLKVQLSGDLVPFLLCVVYLLLKVQLSGDLVPFLLCLFAIEGSIIRRFSAFFIVCC